MEEGRWNGGRYRLLISTMAFDRDAQGNLDKVESLDGVLLLSFDRQ